MIPKPPKHPWKITINVKIVGILIYLSKAGGNTLCGTLTGNITTSLTGDVTASGTNSFSPFVIVQYIIKH